MFEGALLAGMDGQQAPPGQHEDEPHNAGAAERLNWLCAGVLGANDGIVSVAAVVVGVAGATTAHGPILAAGAVDPNTGSSLRAVRVRYSNQWGPPYSVDVGPRFEAKPNCLFDDAEDD